MQSASESVEIAHTKGVRGIPGRLQAESFKKLKCFSSNK